MIQFKNPPERTPRGWKRGPSAATLAIIEALQGRPGEWALIKEDVFVSSTAAWKKRPGIEAKASTIGKQHNKCDIYARWVGVE